MESAAAILTSIGRQVRLNNEVQTKLSLVPLQLELAGLEVRNLLAGRSCDSRVIESPNRATRQVIAAALLAALSGQDLEEQERARQLFLDQGYFDETTRDLKTAEFPADRAAAARKLGIVGSQQATAHLIATVFDSAPEVRRAGAEALLKIRDPWVNTAPLNALIISQKNAAVTEESETIRRVTDNLKSLAINNPTGESRVDTYSALCPPYGREVETARLKFDEEVQRLVEEQAQMAGAGRGAKANERRMEQATIPVGEIVCCFDGRPFLARRWWLLITVNAVAAGALTVAGGLAIQFLVLPFWLGGLVGFLLYLLTLRLDKPDDDCEESQASVAHSFGRQAMN